MGRTVTISLAQVDVSWGQPEENMHKAERWVKEAHQRGSDIVVFPELWTTGYDLQRSGGYASKLGEGVFRGLAKLARRYAVFLTGSLLRREGEAIHNCAPLFSPDGEVVDFYDKVHLFGLMDEDRYLAAGSRTPLLDLPWGKCAVAICYDLRFPELFRKYVLGGAEMIFLPAEWPYPRLEHWRTLLKARAIENECYIVACNRVGTGGDAGFFGHSAVIDPWGQYMVEGGETEALLTVSVDMDMVREVRQRLTVLEDRRPDVY